jgi:two-component system response regulator RegA
MENLKILIIEDDLTTCTLLKTTLELEGYQTTFVHNIENDDVLLLLNDKKPEVLFLDFYLGSQETLNLTIIRNDPDWKDLPVLMTSAIDHRQACLEAGANSFILKPFNWEEITNMVDEIHKQISNE